MGTTLFERLLNPTRPDSRSMQTDPRALFNSIRAHLQTMLNTRRGGSTVAPNFGTTDFADLFRGHASIEVLRGEILESIREYEPRLADVELNFVEPPEEPYTLHFEILAKIIDDDSNVAAVFRTIVASSGQARVSRKED